MTSIAASRTLRPRIRGRAWGRVVALTALFTPMCAVALVLGRASGRVEAAIVLTGSCAIALGFAILVIARSRIDLVPNGLHSRRFDGNRTVTAAQVARVAIRSIRNSDEVTSQRNLFLLDASGTGLLRLSDRWWTEDQIMRIAQHFGAPIEAADEPVGLPELRRVSPEQLRWRERHPWIALAVYASLAGIAGLAAACLGTASL